MDQTRDLVEVTFQLGEERQQTNIQIKGCWVVIKTAEKTHQSKGIRNAKGKGLLFHCQGQGRPPRWR